MSLAHSWPLKVNHLQNSSAITSDLVLLRDRCPELASALVPRSGSCQSSALLGSIDHARPSRSHVPTPSAIARYGRFITARAKLRRIAPDGTASRCTGPYRAASTTVQRRGPPAWHQLHPSSAPRRWQTSACHPARAPQVARDGTGGTSETAALRDLERW